MEVRSSLRIEVNTKENTLIISSMEKGNSKLGVITIKDCSREGDQMGMDLKGRMFMSILASLLMESKKEEDRSRLWMVEWWSVCLLEGWLLRGRSWPTRPARSVGNWLNLPL